MFLLDILPRLKAMEFLDANAWNPGISTAGLTHAFQFGNALPGLFYKSMNKTDMFVLKKIEYLKHFHPLLKSRGFREDHKYIFQLTTGAADVNRQLLILYESFSRRSLLLKKMASYIIDNQLVFEENKTHPQRI